ncbi:MAG TPA: hypothetical protein VN903_15855 [Polyangia bacterium]|nr:hypothetical protein [Polyangia bacterium]
MSRSRFVQPETAILTLGNGDTLVVRRRLNMGEQRESYRICSELVEQDDGTVKRVPDPHRIGLAKVAAFLVDWNLAGDDAPIRGLDLAQRVALVDNLDPEDFYEIKDAIDAHEAATAAARLAEKNGQAGEMNGPAISPLPFVAAGPLT